MKLCGVVVIFHPNDNVIKNIQSYIKELDRLYVVDNSKKSHQQQFKDEKIVYVSNGGNKGIAFALNKGISLAKKDHFKYILTMDQDSYFREGEFQKMKQHVAKEKDDKIGIYTPLHLTGSEKINKTIQQDPLVVMTSGNILNIDIYQKIGGFKDWLFIDCVDHEYCLNLRKNGYQIKVFEEISLSHSLGNIKNIKRFGHTFTVTNHNYFRRYFITRNRLYLNELHKDTFPQFCKQEIKNTQKETIKIILFEKEKWKKLYWTYRGKKDFRKRIKGIPKDLEEEIK